MAFVYTENEPKRFTGRPVPYHEQDAIKHWATHYDNSLYLTFLVKNETDRNARAQATAELTIAERKMTFWKRHPNWNSTEATAIAIESKKKWNM